MTEHSVPEAHTTSQRVNRPLCSTHNPEHAGTRDLTVAILAGGMGVRMGGGKATIRLGQQTLLERTIDRLRPLGGDIVIVTRPEQEIEPPEGTRVVSDLEPYRGAMAGIGGALLAAKTDWSVVVACDMPFVSLDLMRYLATQAHHCDAVVPRLDVGLEPLHALYHKRCLPALQKALQRGARRLRSFFDEIAVRYVDEGDLAVHDEPLLSFFNINTREDLCRALEMLNLSAHCPS